MNNTIRASAGGGRPGVLRRIALPVFLLISAGAQPGSAESTPPLDPVYELKTDGDRRLLATRAWIDLYRFKSESEALAFFAVTSLEWPPEMVPLFGVTREDQFELRRFPPRGRENFLDPLFYALPLEDEPKAKRITGRWDCTATDAHGSKSHFSWEFTLEGEAVRGRFDPGTDYRFAWISGGTFRENQLELKVEYMNHHYTMSGQWADGQWNGAWRRDDGQDHGTWEAVRPSSLSAAPSPEATVPLWEWRRPADGARRYSIHPDLEEPGWERSPRPLARVWPKKVGD